MILTIIVKGIPGSGKSLLISRFIQALDKSGINVSFVSNETVGQEEFTVDLSKNDIRQLITGINRP